MGSSRVIFTFIESVEIDHCFDQPWYEVDAGQPLRRVREIEAVRDERGRVHPARFEQADDLAESAGQTGAAGEEGEFAAMEVRVVESHFAAEQSQENDAAAVLREFERRPHGSGVAGRIDDGGGKLTEVGLQPPGEVRVGGEGRAEAHRAAGKLQPVRLHVHARHVRARCLCEDGRRQPDGTEAEDRRRFATAQRRALHAVRPDDQRLDKRGLFGRQPGGAVELVRGHGDQRRMAAVHVDSQNSQVAAAIRLSRAAGRALPTKVIGLHRAQVSRRERAVRRGGHDLDAEFVTQPARITEERLFARERVDVRAAHPATADAHQRLALRRVRHGNFGPRQRAGLFQQQRSHGMK